MRRGRNNNPPDCDERMDRSGFPGVDLIEEGLRDIAAGESSIPGLPVLSGAPRLRRLGCAIPHRSEIDPVRLLDFSHSIEPKLYRFPAINLKGFREAVHRAIAGG